jgi:hypothetical protein
MGTQRFRDFALNQINFRHLSAGFGGPMLNRTKRVVQRFETIL